MNVSTVEYDPMIEIDVSTIAQRKGTQVDMVNNPTE